MKQRALVCRQGREPAEAEAEVGGLYRVQVLERALRILDVLAAESQLAPSEISARLLLHKIRHPPAGRVGTEPVRRPDQANGMYSLGLKLIELGTRASSRLDLCELAGPILEFGWNRPERRRTSGF